MVNLEDLNESQRRIAEKIIKTAEDQGVDPQLALAVARVESGFSQAAKGTSGEIGVMQLMPATAKSLGVNPKSLDENILGGVTYLKQMLDLTGGDVRRALVGYNGGPDNAKMDNPPNMGYADRVNEVYPFDLISDTKKLVESLDQSQLNDPNVDIIDKTAATMVGAGTGAAAQAAIDLARRTRQENLYNEAQRAAELRKEAAQLRATQAMEDVAAGRASGPKVPGGAAPANYARAMAGQSHQLPERILSEVQDYTKTGEKGAHKIIAKDIENQQRIKNLGLGDYKLSGTGSSQLQLPSNIAAEREAAQIRGEARPRPSGLEQTKVEQARPPKSGRLATLGKGAFTGSLSGAGTAYNLYDLIQKIREGDVPGAAFSALGTAGGALSMAPHPLAKLGGLGLSVAAPYMSQLYDEHIRGR